MNLEETCYLQTLPQHDPKFPFRYKYGDKVRIVSADKGYLDWRQGIVINTSQENGTVRYLIRCIPDREEIWLTESQLCPNLAQDSQQQATKLY